MKTKPAPKTDDASDKITRRIADLDDWRGETLARMRQLIHEADPDIVEEWKWEKPKSGGTPVFSHDGIVCTGESYKEVVKLTFARGAALDDPKKLFNSSLEGNARRAIDLRQGETINKTAFKALIREAVKANTQALADRAAKKTTTKRTATKSAKPKLLSGGNPQIPKGEGDAPVQAYIAAAPGWQQDVCRRLDALIVKTVPGVKKAVKWNTPFYGLEGQGWFVAFHIFTHYVKVTFFRGTLLKPLPSSPSKDKDTRYLDIHEGTLDEAQFVKWVKQAAKLPGWMS